ncbi:hypothetical protein PG993_007630 [Apiospora rasikravindrae]|uniref:Peptidase A1 domain-containing protein n=1 Tax=Apiospora rasikravindrae TaxID=990691 RepID=A0ABR1SY24_9PEZI
MYWVATLLQLTLWISSTQAVNPVLVRHAAGPHENIQQQDVEARAVGLPPLGFVTFKLTPTSQQRDEPHGNGVSRVAQNLARKYGSYLPSRTAASDHVIEGRENNYNIVKANPPTKSNSAGVDQDGTDYSYFVEANFGSDGSLMYMLLDTGASSSWVMGSGCTSEACSMHNTFKSDGSSTLKDSGKPFSVEYGSGSVSGSLVTDTVKIAGMTVTMDFGLAKTTSQQFTSFPFDGILGLSIGNGGPQNFLVALKGAKVVDTNVFAVSLSRNSDGLNDGEIAFGAPNPDKFTGDIAYTPVDPKFKGSWAINFDDVSVSGKPVGIKDKLAYIDTGTTFAFAPPADAKIMYGAIPDAKSADDGVTWTMPCDTKAELSFSFGGKSFKISPKDFLSAPDDKNRCTGNIYGMEVVRGAWLLGGTLLKSVYAVFDMDQARIGFAAKPAVTPSTTSSAASTTIVKTTTLDGGAVVTTTMTSSRPKPTGNPVGLSGHQSSSPGPTKAPEETDSSTPGSPGEQLHIRGSYVSFFCIASILAIMA